MNREYFFSSKQFISFITKKHNLFFNLLVLVAIIAISSCGSNKPTEILEAEKNLPQVIDFNFHVKPILSDNCYACHGPGMANQKGVVNRD